MQRRLFLSAAGAAGLNLDLQGAEQDWFDRPMRWSQLTLTEDDPPKFDTKFWLNYFARIHSDAACLSAGGVVAYYPTKVPFHHRSKWLGDRDPFGELVKGCREQKMVVIARTDPHAIHQDAVDAHPDWVMVNAAGKPVRHGSDPTLWLGCALGPYNFEFLTEVHKEIMTLYKVDGIFTNRWAGSGMCYCQHCVANFRKASGMDLPRTNDPLNPSRRAYNEWRQARLFELWRVWDAAIQPINPRSRYIANAGGGALSNLDMKKIGEMAPTLFADRQARHGLMAPWANGKNGKEYRAALGAKPIVGIFSVGVEEEYRWKDSVQSDAEIRIWVAEGVANGLRSWWTKFSAAVWDPRWMKTVERMYQWQYKWEKYLRNEAPVADVGIVYSQQTATYYGGSRARETVEDHTLGWYQALLEARVPFEMVHDRMLDQAGKFKALILPNIAALSDAQCAQLRRFAENGGRLIATHETSLYNEWGEKRKDFGLGDLFGVSYAGTVAKHVKNSYLKLNHPHPLLKGLEEAPRIIHGANRVDVKALAGRTFSSKPLTLIPSYPDLPMEMVYPRESSTSPELFLSERVAYFNFDIDRTFWEVLSTDHGTLLKNVVDWATDGRRPVHVEGHGFVDVTVWRQSGSMTVHLVNLTNPMTMKGPYRELIPVGEQKVRLLLPNGLKAKSVRLLAADKSVAHRVENGWLHVSVPSVLDHEIVAVDV